MKIVYEVINDEFGTTFAVFEKKEDADSLIKHDIKNFYIEELYIFNSIDEYTTYIKRNYPVSQWTYYGVQRKDKNYQ